MKAPDELVAVEVCLFIRLRGLFAILLVLALYACGQDEAAQPPGAPPVEVLTVRAKPVIPRVEYVGRVEAIDELKVRPKVGGYILRRHFKEGDVVTEGQLLFEIDPAPFEARVESHAANVAQAEAAVKIAERNFFRGKKLIPRGAISEVQFDELASNFDQSQAVLMAAEADLVNAQLDLSYTKVIAPLTGRIGRTDFANGSLVGPETSELATIVKLDPVYVRFDVPEDQLLSFRMARLSGEAAGKPVAVTYRILLPNGEYYPHEGKLEFFDNQIDPTTGSVAVRASFPNPDKLLVHGQYAKVTIRLDFGDAAMQPLVPQSAVMEDIQGRYVFVIGKDNVAEKRYLKLGQREGELWAVTNGLTVGENIVVSGLQRIVVDQPVQPQAPEVDPYEPPEEEGKDVPGAAADETHEANKP